MSLQHYSPPSFNNTTSEIKLQQFELMQHLVIKDDPSNLHQIYVVLDNTQLPESIQDAIDHEHIGLLTDQANTDVAVDDITIEKEPGFSKIVVTPTIEEAFGTAWEPSIVGPFDNGVYDPDSGAITILSGIDYIIEDWNDSNTLPTGTYEFYANKNIDSHDINLSLSSGTFNFDPGVYENGLWRYSCTVTTAGTFNILQSNEDREPATIWLINKFDTSIDDEITIKNIDWIIGRNNSSIDGSFTEATDADAVIVTKAFVEGRIPEADDITIQDINNEPTVSTNSDYQLVLQEAFDNRFPSSGWTINQNYGNPLPTVINFSNGVFSIDSGTTIDNGDVFGLYDNGNTGYFPAIEGNYHRVYTNIDFDANGLEFTMIDFQSPGSSNAVHHEQKQIFNGMYELTLFVGGGMQINHARISKTSGSSYILPEDLTIQFIITEQYPSNKISKIKNIDQIIDYDDRSIDGSASHTDNFQRELVTKSYVEHATAEPDDITISEEIVFGLDVNEAVNIDRMWRMNGVSTTINSGTYNKGIFTSDNVNFEVDIDFVSPNLQTPKFGYRVWVSENVSTSDIHLTIDGIQINSTLMLPMFGGYVFHFPYDRTTTPAGVCNLYVKGSAVITVKLVPVKVEHTIKNIDYIIDDDLESIDGSDTPMSDPHRELVTRAFVENSTAKVDDRTIEFSQITEKFSYAPTVRDNMIEVWEDPNPTNLSGNTATYDNGMISSDSGVVEMYYTNSVPLVAGTYSFWTDIDVTATGGTLIFGEQGSEVTYSTMTTVDGGFKYDVVIPADIPVGSTVGGHSETSTGLDYKQKNYLFTPIVSVSEELRSLEVDRIIDSSGHATYNQVIEMFDKDRELPTRGYVEHYVELLSNWIKRAGTYGPELYPTDTTVKTMMIDAASHGFNQILIRNAENETGNDNYTGAAVVLTASATDYNNQTFISHHGDDHYDATLRSRGMIGTDSSLIIAAYNSTDKQGAPAFVDFRVGDDYWNQKSIFKLTTNGLEMTLSDKKFWYEAGKTPQADPASWTLLKCNTTTGEVYASAAPNPPTKDTETFTITATDVVNGYIDLTNIPIITGEHLFTYYNGLFWTLGDDFSISNNRITFIATVNTGDKLTVLYSY